MNRKLKLADVALRGGKVVSPKYTVDLSKRKHLNQPIFQVTQVVTINEDEVEDFKKRNKRLPEFVYPIGKDKK